MSQSITNFVATGQDAMSDGDVTPHSEKYLTPPLSSRRSREDALRESLLDENHGLEHKVWELEKTNSSLRQSCARKESEVDALQEQISDYEDQLQALRKAARAETRRSADQAPCETHVEVVTTHAVASTQQARALEELADELRRVKASSRQAQEEVLALHRQAHDDAESLQIQLEDVENKRRDLEAELQSQGDVMKEAELGFDAERKRFEERIRQLEEQRRAEAEAMMVERSGTEGSKAPAARTSLLAQIHKISTGELSKGGKSCPDLEAQTCPCPTRSMWTPVMALLILQAVLAALRILVLRDLIGGLYMVIPISAGWYAWHNRKESDVTFVCIWGLACLIDGALGLGTVLDAAMYSPMPLFASRATLAYNLHSLLLVLIPVSLLSAVPMAWCIYKRHGEVGELSDASHANSYATFEGNGHRLGIV